MTKFALLAMGIAVAATASAQNDLKPVGQYPQFRTLSGLPGGGFGVRPDGSTGFDGAMSFSSPIGYSLNNFHFSVGLANTSDNEFFRLPHTGGNNGNVDSIGKAAGMIGLPLGRYGSVTTSVMLVSSVGDRAYNAQYQAPLFYRNVGVSIGVQDIQGHRGIGAQGLPGANVTSRSFYGAVTVPLPLGAYVSGGVGDRRFEKGFASGSIPFAGDFKAVVEHDGFNFNPAIAYHPHWLDKMSIKGYHGTATIMAGLVRGKYAFWSLNASF